MVRLMPIVFGLCVVKEEHSESHISSKMSIAFLEDMFCLGIERICVYSLDETFVFFNPKLGALCVDSSQFTVLSAYDKSEQ